ncbi:hypothetical protein ABTM08_19895, partial [Acinetobacter baumannii]
RDKLSKAALARFVQVVERATLYTLNHPGEAWDAFKAYDKALDNDLNRRAWADTLRRFNATPAALDPARYARFAAFLKKQGLIKVEPK